MLTTKQEQTLKEAYDKRMTLHSELNSLNNVANILRMRRGLRDLFDETSAQIQTTRAAITDLGKVILELETARTYKT